MAASKSKTRNRAFQWTAHRVARLRRRLGLSQEQFAKELHVTYGTVYRWEHGRVSPKGISLRALDAIDGGRELPHRSVKELPAPAWSAERIKHLRDRLGLTQEAFAEELGVTYVTVNRWENGHASPKGVTLRALDAVSVGSDFSQQRTKGLPAPGCSAEQIARLRTRP